MFSGIGCLRISKKCHRRCLGGSFLLNLSENDLFFSSVEIYFLEVGARVSLKGATTGLWECHFCWIWEKISHFFKYINGGLGPKTIIVELLKLSCFRLSRNKFCGIWCIHVSETRHQRSLRWSLLLNLCENTTIF